MGRLTLMGCGPGGIAQEAPPPDETPGGGGDGGDAGTETGGVSPGDSTGFIFSQNHVLTSTEQNQLWQYIKEKFAVF